MRAIYLLLGLAFLALGFIGIFLPVLPTTPFLILAAACFARSSPRLEAWLSGHPRFGPLLTDWRARGAIPRRAKWLALAGICLGFTLFIASAKAEPAVIGLVGVLMLSGLAYVFSRPS
jgi:uncharacterized membrane protein YbaN (DUF454 family)